MPCAALAASGAASKGVDVRIDDSRITESSGLALSVRHPHTVWTGNDSGDTARVFAIDTETGKTVGVHTFDTEVRDVEALAITPQGRMLVADIGDNDSARPVVRVFWFDEPELGSTSGAWASWELSYPDGPHNAESIAVDPTSGRVFVVTKGRPGAVYALPATPSRKGVNRLTKVGPAPDIATDAVFLQGGSGLAVRTYTSLVVLDPDTWRETSYQVLPLQPQGETLALAPDGNGLLVGTEGTHSRIQQVAINVPASSTTTTAPSPTATPGGAPATSGQSQPQTQSQTRAVGDGEGSRLVANRGELFAGLGACAGLVLLAYLIARLARRGRR
ncbi:hypothetical protein EAH86_13355 [Pedococcus bigeumensis]|uniref:WD40 repeat domain-containing protein n=2 Tax=Pedococcus bigeumensis TaxID=433644 RepID=A0A502CU24_9MICO|nr:hypothetical protein EAH86_13355 [Pedococcus bigeumensis]